MDPPKVGPTQPYSPPSSSVMGFSRQEYWSGLPCLPPGDLPDPGIKPISPAATALKAGSLPLSKQGSSPSYHPQLKVNATSVPSTSTNGT